MENVLHQRQLQSQTSCESESEISDSENTDGERTPPSSDEERVPVDPGPFQYNKRICAAALPCFLVVIMLVGELLSIIITVGTALIILLDQIGEKRRSIIVFMFFFVPCHILILVSTLPLIWLSVWNIFLIAAINMYVLLTGGWLLLQFSSFRSEEPLLCQGIERMLFTVYPGVCVALMTWVTSTVTPLTVSPLILLALGFVFLQIFLTPAVSSFKVRVTGDEDMNVIQQPIVCAVIVAFCLLPSFLHGFLNLVAPSADGLFSKKSLIQLVFTVSMSVFLATLLSVRQFFEYAGWQYVIVIRARWTSGMVATLLCYPLLEKFKLSSHFLPWLPVAIVAFAVLGLILANRRYWLTSLLMMLGLTLLLGFWISVLPWQLKYYLLNSIHINIFYILLCVNFLLCLLCLYVVTHGSEDLLAFLISLQSLVLAVCEVALYKSNLYSLSLTVTTGALATYMLHRLYLADKIHESCVLFSSAIQITKLLAALLSTLVNLQGQITAVSYIFIFFFVYMILKNFVYETLEEVPWKKAVINLFLLLLSLATNAYPLLSTLCYSLWQSKPTFTDLIGTWFAVGGMLVLLFAQTHVQMTSDVRASAFIMLLVGGAILGLQPQIGLSMYALFQWGEIASLLLLVAVLSSNLSPTASQAAICSVLVGLCPGIRLVLQLYGEFSSVFYPVLHVVLISCVIMLVIIYSKIHSLAETLETSIKYACAGIGASLTALFVLDVSSKESSDSLISLPVWKCMMGATVTSSIILKLLSYKKGPDSLPLTHAKEEKSLPIIPLVANLITILAFLLLCLQGPADGFLHDMWCCAAALILICLQKDFRIIFTLKEQNQMTPTVMCAIGVLLVAAILRNGIWTGTGMWSIFCGIVEIILIPMTLPVYVILWGILWRNQLFSEQAVVFSVPINAVLFLVASSYTTWAIGACGLLTGTWMMVFKLPMLPYDPQDMTR